MYVGLRSTETENLQSVTVIDLKQHRPDCINEKPNPTGVVRVERTTSFCIGSFVLSVSRAGHARQGRMKRCANRSVRHELLRKERSDAAGTECAMVLRVVTVICAGAMRLALIRCRSRQQKNGLRSTAAFQAISRGGHAKRKRIGSPVSPASVRKEHGVAILLAIDLRIIHLDALAFPSDVINRIIVNESIQFLKRHPSIQVRIRHHRACLDL